MKLVILIVGLLITLSHSAQAQIFKCETSQVFVIYQDKECTNSINQKQLYIQKFNPDKIEKAQKKLSKDLQQHEKLKAARKEQALKETREEAIKEQIKSNEELTNATREYTYAIEKHTKDIRSNNQRNNVYYYGHPRYHSSQIYPAKKPHFQENSHQKKQTRHTDNFNPPTGR